MKHANIKPKIIVFFFSFCFLFVFLHKLQLINSRPSYPDTIKNIELFKEKLNNLTYNLNYSLMHPIKNNIPKKQDASEGKFNYLTVTKIQNHPEIAHFYNLENINATGKLQNIALYISNKYSTPLYLAEKIVFYAHINAIKQGISPLLALSVIGVESTFRPNSKSHAGAIGLTQVIPRWHPEEMSRLPTKNSIWDVSWNIYIGMLILNKYLEDHNGNIVMALQKYNGSTRDQTRRYSRKVLGKYRMFKEEFK